MSCSYCVAQVKKSGVLKRSTSKTKGQLAPNTNLLHTDNYGGSALASDYETDESEDHHGKESTPSIPIKEMKVLENFVSYKSFQM